MLRDRVERFFAKRMVANYDRCMRPLERNLFGAARERVVPHASGLVLEVGAGSGVNFELYPPQVARVVAFDPEPGMLSNARARAARAGVPVDLVAASAERMPFREATFDTVVATLVFCTIGDAERALAETARVLVPGGRLLMIEHVRSSSWPLAVVQDLATPIQKIIAAGCHLNRRTQELVARAGFRIERISDRLLGSIVEIDAVRTG